MTKATAGTAMPRARRDPGDDNCLWWAAGLFEGEGTSFSDGVLSMVLGFYKLKSSW
jgi:hypothetical protein